MSQSAQLQTDQSAGPLLRGRLPAPVLIAAALLALEVGAILALGGGRFSYTLDDAYIHLAVSEEIARGGYGINRGEFAAPASSILWPLLLAPFASFDWHAVLPLILNAAALIGCVAVLCRMVGEGLAAEESPLLRGGLPIVLCLAAGLVPIALTGMEHLLQAWLALLVLLGASTAEKEGEAPWWLWPALALGPLLRYESLALTLPMAILLWQSGHRRAVAFTLAVTGAALIGFSGLLLWHGLPPLPSSVLSKASLSGPAVSPFLLLARGIQKQLVVGEGWVLLALTGALLVTAARLPNRRGIARALAAATALHFAFGLTRTSFGRYECYILLCGLTFLGMILAPRLGALARSRGAWVALLTTALLLTPLWPRSVYRLLVTPLAADNIGSQQREMRRFATELWGEPVAVNDIGWVSYRNEAYVLDLWGLGLEEARRKRLAGDTSFAAELLRRKDVALMMIYDGWLGEAVPADWVHIGRLVLTRRRVSAASAEVDFYARPDRAEDVAELAQRFAGEPPAGAAFRFAD